MVQRMDMQLLVPVISIYRLQYILATFDLYLKMLVAWKLWE